MTQRNQNKIRIGVFILLMLVATLMSECAQGFCGRGFAELWKNCAIGMEKSEKNLSTIPIEMIPYYRKYNALFNPKFYVPAKFVPNLKNEPNPRTIGICNIEDLMIFGREREGEPNLSIEISREYWDISSEADREQLMFHEMGHCMSGLDHVSETEFSLMTPRQQPTIVYQTLRFLFWLELEKRVGAD